MTVSDQTGKHWVTVFNDQAVPLLNHKTADELYQLKEGGQVRGIFYAALAAESKAVRIHPTGLKS